MRDDKPIPRKYNPNEDAGVTTRRPKQKIISGNARVKQKTGVSKFADSFISEDAKDVKSQMIFDVLIPGVKKIIYDLFTEGIDMILYGGRGSGDRRRNPVDRLSFVQYDKYYEKGSRSARSESSRPKAVYDYGDLTVPSKGDAEAILDQLDAQIKRYDIASVADLYEFAGITPRPTDYKYGWTDISSATSVRLRTGEYILKLPKALPLD